MPRLAPYIGSVSLMALGICAVLVANHYTEPSAGPISVPVTATSSLSVLPTFTLPDIALSPLMSDEATTTVAAPAATTTSKSVAKLPKKSPTPTTPAPAPIAAPVITPQPAPVTASSGNVPLETVATTLRGALVNIICYTPAGSQIRSTSGSGVIIDPKGIILTNAHIGQYFLLETRGVSCTIRTGGPAVNAYKAEIIYISPEWIRENRTILSQSAPIGTGEFDFAFLAITKSATAKALPDTFPYIPLAELPPPADAPVVIASYGAQFLQSSQIQSFLFPTVVYGTVREIFTFGRNTADVLELGGSAAAQQGSSGGGVADASGSLVGTITTSTTEGPTDTRSLSALSASYIRGEYATEMGSALDLLLAEPVANAVADFASQIPFLESIITAHLD